MIQQQKYAAALESAIADLLSRVPMEINEIQSLVLRDLPAGDRRTALMRHRFTLGLSMCPNSRVLVDDSGGPVSVAAVLGPVLVP